MPKQAQLQKSVSVSVSKQAVPSQQKLDKVLVKAACKSNLKEVKLFTIRDVDFGSMETLTDLKMLIKDQLRDDLRKTFDVGYVQGTNVITIRSMEDMDEMWLELKKPRSTSTLWCDGLIDSTPQKKSRRRRLLSDDSDDDLPPTKKKKMDKQEEVQKIVDSLKSNHGTRYTALQLRIWAELISGGLHSSEDHPPNNNSMFERAGSGGSSKPTHKDSGVAKVVADAASAITNALTTTGQSSGSYVRAVPSYTSSFLNYKTLKVVVYLMKTSMQMRKKL